MEGTEETNEGMLGANTYDDTSPSGVETEDLENEKEEYNPKESVRETVIKAVEARKAQEASKGNKSDNDSQETPTEKPVLNAKTAKTKDDVVDSLDPDLSPPARLNAEAKQVFNNLPKTLKRWYAKSIKDLEAETTRTQQNLSPKLKEYAQIDQIIAPHLPEWVQMGLSKDAAIAELINTHSKLKNPQTKEETLRWLAHNTGQAHLLRDVGEEGSPIADISQNPYVKELENKLASLQQQVSPILSNYQQSVSQIEQREIDTATQEVNAVLDEKDASGRYRYPRLHEPQFVAQVRPLVAETVKTFPQLGYGNALKKVYEMFEAPVGVAVGNLNGRSNGSPHTNNQPNRAMTAAVSARGNSSLPASDLNGDIELPPEARKSVRDTVIWAIKQRTGRG